MRNELVDFLSEVCKLRFEFDDSVIDKVYYERCFLIFVEIEEKFLVKFVVLY